MELWLTLSAFFSAGPGARVVPTLGAGQTTVQRAPRRQDTSASAPPAEVEAPPAITYGAKDAASPAPTSAAGSAAKSPDPMSPSEGAWGEGGASPFVDEDTARLCVIRGGRVSGTSCWELSGGQLRSTSFGGRLPGSCQNAGSRVAGRNI